MILQVADGHLRAAPQPPWLSARCSSPPPPRCCLCSIHSVTNRGGGKLRQVPTEIGCCLCVIMLL